MRTGLANQLRAILRGHDDGLSVPALADMTSTHVEAVRKRLKEMPDVYIDRWEKQRYGYTAIWCIVTPPDHCPRPAK